MALYYYIPSKHDLLNLLLDAAYAELKLPESKVMNWRTTLEHFAWENRRCGQRHPWIAQLRTPDREYGPGCIESLECFLNSLAKSGLDSTAAMRMLSALFVFVNGFVADESGSKDAQAVRKKANSRTRPIAFSSAMLATGKYPNVARFAEGGVEPSNDKSFERGLQWMLDGIEVGLKARRSVAKKSTRVRRATMIVDSAEKRRARA